MTGPELIEELTDIIARQSRIIYELYSVVEQLNATTSLEVDVREVSEKARQILGGPE